jgi:predicted negative regulator of RcsB-dependent stress response
MAAWVEENVLGLVTMAITFIAGIFGYGKFVSNIQARGKSNSHRLDQISENIKKLEVEVSDIDNKQSLNDGKLDVLIKGQEQTQELIKVLINNKK